MLKVTTNLSNLEKLGDNLKEMGGTRTVSLTDVLTPEFVSQNTKYPNFEAILAEVGVTTAEEFKALPDADFDSFLAANTKFSTWAEMQKEAGVAYAKAQLLKGLRR